MRTIIGGNNDLACRVLEWLVDQNEEVVATVPEDKDIVSKVESWERPFLPLVEEKGIRKYVGNINRFSEQIRRLNPDLIILCRSYALVRPKILDIPSIGCVNFHYGELPKYGGCNTIQWAILNKEDHIGVTLHFMNEKFDEGPIIDQRKVDISRGNRILQLPNKEIIVPGLTAFEAYLEAGNLAFQMFTSNYPLIKSGEYKVTRQDQDKSSYYPKNSIDFNKDKYLDLDEHDDAHIARYVRAFTFPPKQLPVGRIKGKNWKELELNG